jgi:hypothetical protein
MVTVHVPVPEQAPDQAPKAVWMDALAVRVTAVPYGNRWEQIAPQSMPAGELVTVPPLAPRPALATVSVSEAMPKLAVTEAASFVVTVHVPVPEHAPDQPVKVDPVPGVAVRVTDVP